MDGKNKSVARMLETAERAANLAQELAPRIRAHWDRIHESVTEKTEKIDFGAAGLLLGQNIVLLRAQLSVAAITAEIDPGLKADQMVLRSQAVLNRWLEKLRYLFLLSGFEAEGDSLQTRTTFFRRIRGLRRSPQAQRPKTIPSLFLMQSILAMDPKILLETQMGMLAMAGFPDRPRTPQQERRKRRRRRRSSPGALSGSLRPARAEEDEDE